MPSTNSRQTVSARPRVAGEPREQSMQRRRTTDAVRLSDPAAERDVQALVRDVTRSPTQAQAFLREAGILTPTGRLSRRFGGA